MIGALIWPCDAVLTSEAGHLIEAGADPRARDTYGESVSDWARDNGAVVGAPLLLNVLSP